MFVIFPFEEKLYKDSGVDAVFIGNPLIGRVPDKKSFKVSNPGLFSGNRRNVVSCHIPVILETAKILKEKNKHKICNV
ncbi:hypothetical protein ATZ36_11055 [Candidatus Endomicrobiellum trichonymphae]|uniref:Uncharacterized protein n=1 Tax=Endomicrobium trichonymphae TaxID=1408204 RepID=A0A1E5IGP3_ENDTX|nr:hypothetical protein ATZ36_11055 [Candidatus Endomicrobium trichonymphae]